MAPVKRSRRAVEEGDDDEVIDVQEARSNFRGEQSRKRARVSVNGYVRERAPRRDETTDSESEDANENVGDEDEDEDDDDDDDRHNTPPQTQYELMRDAGFKHLEHIEYDDRQATQRLRRRPTTLGNNMVAESGIIEWITCCNFMCHEKLHVELGPLINFIVGENGSGKSAVLTALTLCLGGKASDTNRGGSLKSFVKEGCDQCSLVVSIKNAGSDAYQPDIYGKSIIVERHFSRFGGSGFRIKSETGRIVSTRKQEVEEISEWYALQIGNPLTVLSQDNARQFLNSATPAQKYKYFIAGVQLEQLDNDYKMSQDTLDKTLLLREDLGSKIELVKKEMDEAQRLAETAQKNQSLREKSRHYRNQLVWSQIVEQENHLARYDEEIQKCQQRSSEAEQDCEEMANALVAAEQKLARAREARERLDEERDSFDDIVSTAQEAFQAARKELTDLHHEERDAHSRLTILKETIQRCESKIQEEEHRLGESTGSARAEKDAELAEANEKAKRLEEEIAEGNEELPVLQARVDQAEEAVRQSKKLNENKRNDVLAAENHLQELRKSTGSVYDGFDREIVNLVKEIEKDRGFQSKPVGPLGAHIRLLKPEWSSLIERTLGETLNTFIVTSKADQSRLSDLMRRMGMHRSPPISIAYSGSIDTSNQEPAAQFDTILKVLSFDNDLVRSQLIINNMIEKIILVEERVEAERIMIDHGPPRNVAACICFHDGRGKRGQGLRITNRNGTIGTTPVKPTGQRPRMQSDSVRQIALQEDNLRQLGLELRDTMIEQRQAQQALQRCKTELDTLRKQNKKLSDDLRRAQADVERVSMELDAFEGVDDRLIGLRTELETKRAEKEQLGAQYGAMNLAKRDLNARAEEAKRRLESVKQEQAEFQRRVNKVDNKIQSSESMRRIAVSKKNDAFERLDLAKDEKRRVEEKRVDKAAEVEDFTRQAQNVAPTRVHIPEDENYASIEKKYEKVMEQLKQREARLGATDEQIYDRANEAKQRYDDVIKQTRDVDETIASLKRAIEHRLEIWRKFQRQISARIRIQFNYLLSERGFRGKIDLDHQARKVLIQIEPDETKKNSTGRNTKTLSGGEKSFSSICMLLSVWEAIGSPIRCLDEFDVFMDNVNRAISTNMLVDAARRSVSRQYILITPNVIEGRASLDKDVHIIRLTDPRQRRLDY